MSGPADTDVGDGEMTKIKQLIKFYLLEQNMKHVTVDIDKLDGAGIAYMSVILKAKSTGRRNGHSFDDSFVIKRLRSGTEHDEKRYEIHWSRCEVYAYQTIFPAISELQREYNIKSKFRHAEYVTSSIENGTALVILKDLTSVGFSLRDRSLLLDFEHVDVLLWRLSQFHASSFALKHLKRDKYVAITSKHMEEKLFANEALHFDYFERVWRPQMARFVAQCEDGEFRDKLVIMTGRLTSAVSELVESDAGPYSVIGHGDTWSNNAMFEYQNNKPKDAVLLDWQTIRLNSPVLDLFHLITTSISEDLQTAAGFTLIIDTYYKHLCDELERYHLDGKTVFPEGVLWQHLRKYAPIGVMICLVMWPYHCRYVDNLIEPAQIKDDIKKLLDMTERSKKRYDRMWEFVFRVFDKFHMLDFV